MEFFSNLRNSGEAKRAGSVIGNTQTFKCSLFSTVYRPGTLTVTDGVISFVSPVLSEGVSLSFKDIALLSKDDKGLGLFATITVQATDQKEYVFSGFFSVTKVYNLLQHLWNATMKKKLNSAQSTYETLEKSEHPSLFEDGLHVFTEENSDIMLKVVTGNFHRLFRLPKEEQLIKEASGCLYGKAYSELPGKIFLSSNFFCFCSERQHMLLTIPFVSIKDIDYKKSVMRLSMGTNPITKRSRVHAYGIKGDAALVISTLKDLWQKKKAAVDLISLDPTPSEEETEKRSPPGLTQAMLNNEICFAGKYIQNQQKQAEKWTRYFASYGASVSMVKVPQLLKLLVEGGIPEQFRGGVWAITSGAKAKSVVLPDQYKQLLAAHKDTKSLLVDEIERDLHRSCPEHEWFSTPQGLSSLRNILVAYAHKNNETGYCQAMNIIASTLLIYMTEEDAFWTLSCVVEDLVTDVYHRSLVGSIVDEKLFQFIVETHLPSIYAHLKSVDVPLALASQPWFLCLFIGYVPFEVSLHILDWFFLLGYETLFCVALAVLKVKEAQILQENQEGNILMLLKEQIPLSQCGDLLKVAFTFFDALPRAKLEELRSVYKFDTIQAMEATNKKKMMMEFSEVTTFTTQELQELYSIFQEALAKMIEPVNYIEFEHFCAIWPKVFPQWANVSGIVELVFQNFDKNRKGRLDFKDFVHGVHGVKKSALQEQFQYCYNLYSRSGSIDRKGLFNVLYTFLSLHTTPRDEVQTRNELNGMTRMAFEKLNRGPNDLLTYEEVIGEVMTESNPMILNLLDASVLEALKRL